MRSAWTDHFACEVHLADLALRIEGGGNAASNSTICASLCPHQGDRAGLSAAQRTSARTFSLSACCGPAEDPCCGSCPSHGPHTTRDTGRGTDQRQKCAAVRGSCRLPLVKTRRSPSPKPSFPWSCCHHSDPALQKAGTEALPFSTLGPLGFFGLFVHCTCVFVFFEMSTGPRTSENIQHI